jgi:adenylate cyclase
MVAPMLKVSPWLECRSSGARHALEESGVVGRGPTARLRVDNSGVSREHASLLRREGSWWVQDLGSANGTFVNGLPANVPVRLRNGDELSFGPARYVFRSGDGDASSTHGDTSEVTIVGPGGPRPQEVTLLVADVIGFSEFSTRFPASDIGKTMSEWCAQCRKVFFDCGGHVDKFIGDCVFGWWHGFGAAVKSQAIQAARTIAAGLPGTDLPDGSPLRCGVGLHSGEAVLSRLGPGTHTLLGSDVNLAFRIESLSRKLEPVVVTRPFANGWPDDTTWQFHSLGTHEVKGWPHPVEVCGVKERAAA